MDKGKLVAWRVWMKDGWYKKESWNRMRQLTNKQINKHKYMIKEAKDTRVRVQKELMQEVNWNMNFLYQN